LTRNFKATVSKRVQKDGLFAQALRDETATLFLNGEPETTSLIVRDLFNATIGFEQLAGAFSSSLIPLVVCRPQTPKTLASKTPEF
jgi:hypothetical protein